MTCHPSLPVLLALLTIGAPASADLYQVDYTGCSLFTITSMNGDNTSHDEQRQWFQDFTQLDERFHAGSFAGTGLAVADADVQFILTQNSIRWNGSVNNHLVIGDQVSSHCQTESYLDIQFTLTQPTAFQFSGEATLTLDPPDYQPFTAVLRVDWPHGSSGVLAPGRYRMSSQAKLLYELRASDNVPEVNSNATYYAELLLSPVPAPGAASLVGVAGVLCHRRRRTR